MSVKVTFTFSRYTITYNKLDVPREYIRNVPAICFITPAKKCFLCTDYKHITKKKNSEVSSFTKLSAFQITEDDYNKAKIQNMFLLFM